MYCNHKSCLISILHQYAAGVARLGLVFAALLPLSCRFYGVSDPLWPGILKFTRTGLPRGRKLPAGGF